MIAPPVSWTPMYFGDDLALNQVSPETHDTDPLWLEVYEIPRSICLRLVPRPRTE